MGGTHGSSGNRRDRRAQSLSPTTRAMGGQDSGKRLKGKSQQPLFPLRIYLHHVKRLAHHVLLGDTGTESICVGIEDIELIALDHVNNVAAGNRLQARYVKVLAEG